MQISRAFLPAVALIVLATGCGGGGGGGTAALPLASTLRSYQQGDNWQYDVSGSVSNGSQTLNAHGTLTVSVSQGTMNSITGPALTETLSVTASNGAKVDETLILYCQQAANGDLLAIGDNAGTGGSIRVVSVPKVFYPGTWSASTSLDNRLDFTNGQYAQNTLTVVGTEVVSVPAGTFTTWKTSETETDSDGGHSADTAWWAPQMGMPVKLVINTTSADGTSVSATATLASTNVPLH